MNPGKNEIPNVKANQLQNPAFQIQKKVFLSLATTHTYIL